MYLVTASSDAVTETAYATSLGIHEQQVRHLSPGSIRLRAVPVLMAVDASGTIRHVWFGAPKASTQAEILEAVAALAGTSQR